MASGVFGLKKVYKRQVENINNGNFASWSEGATYGYYAGGQPPATGISSIDRLDFFTEVLSSPGTPLGRSTNEFDGFSSSLYGYFGGGDTPTTSSASTIDRLDFSTETISNPGNNLNPARQVHAATSSTSYGYFGGGDNSGTLISTITRLDFSSETVSDPGNNLPTARFALAATESSSYGYFGGGDGTVNGGTPLSTVNRLDFSNDSISSPGNPLTVQRTESATISNVDSYGYFGGGNPTYESVGRSSSIIRLDFSNEISVILQNFGLPQRMDKLSATYNNSSGYFAGGQTNVTPVTTLTSSISRFDFSNETVRDITSVLPIAKNSMAALSGGQSILRGKGFKTYGYFGAGRDGLTSLIFRLDFSSQTFSNLTNVLSNARGYLAAISSNDYGYFAGGDSVSTIDRLDFSNETTSLPGKNLPSITLEFAGTSSNSYGYFGGGSPGSPGTKSTISRLDFSNETLSLPGKNLPTARSSLAATSSNSYGYFGGGNTPTVTNINRLDFSNETISLLGSSVGAPTSLAFSSSFYGYFGGGATITRLNFSDETVSNPGKNLPTPRTNATATSSNSYGYIGGGDPNAITQNIDRLDLSTEIVNNLGAILPSPTKNQAALSNSN